MTPAREPGQTLERAEQRLLDPEETEALCTRVAEFMGWRKLEYSSSRILIGLPPGSKRPTPVPAYSRDIKAAWDIVDFLALRGVRTQIETKLLGGSLRTYVVEIGDRKAPISRATYVWPATAVCMAFELAARFVLNHPAP